MLDNATVVFRKFGSRGKTRRYLIDIYVREYVHESHIHGVSECVLVFQARGCASERKKIPPDPLRQQLTPFAAVVLTDRLIGGSAKWTCNAEMDSFRNPFASLALSLR